MQSKKPGLADLKRLARQAQAAAAESPDQNTPAPDRPMRASFARALDAAPVSQAVPQPDLRRDQTPSHPAPGTAPLHPAMAQQLAGWKSARKREAKVASVEPASAASVARGAAASADRPAPAVPPQDAALFRRFVGEVAAVDTRNRILHPKPIPDPIAQRPARGATDSTLTMPSDRPADAGLSDFGVSHLLCEDGTAFLRPGTGPEILKKIAQRYWRIEADIDLHGMTIDQARARLADFIVQCVAYEARCVRVVHGQGYGSPDAQSVLRDRVRAWLVGLNDVRAFAQAPQRDGGAGATIVLLRADDRRSRDRRT